MSHLSEEVYELLKANLPHYKVLKEHFISYSNYKLYFDFYLPELNIAIEVQGVQHDRFVEHFHGDVRGFKMQKKRDFAKKEWALENRIRLVEFREAEFPMSSAEFLNKISGV